MRAVKRKYPKLVCAKCGRTITSTAKGKPHRHKWEAIFSEVAGFCSGSLLPGLPIGQKQ